MWWDIHDSVEDLVMPVRRKLDAIGLIPIDKVTFEELEEACQAAAGLDSIFALASRARDKLNDSPQPEARFSTAVDSVR